MTGKGGGSRLRIAGCFLLLWIAASPIQAQVTGPVDLTLVAESSGSDVVLACVALVQDSQLFPATSRLLRRIAYVESTDGSDPDTYRAGFDGGIWQVEESVFLATQDTSDPDLAALIDGVNQQFGIDWVQMQWSDLRVPLFSAIAARLFLSTVMDSIPLARDISAQAQYWMTNYNQAGDTQEFIDDVELPEQLEGIVSIRCVIWLCSMRRILS